MLGALMPLPGDIRGGVGIQLAAIEFYAGPPVLGSPDDLDAVIREFIDGPSRRCW
jgi:hypothetical protein